MAETATYSWSSFNEEVAKVGVRVGIRQTDVNDLSVTGLLSSSSIYATYKTVIDGKTLYINNFGVIVKCVPEDAKLLNKTVQILTCEIKTTYGTEQGITRGISDDSESVATLSSMEPRDQFAIYAMQAIMQTLGDNPAELDDANILFNCRAAYRWAQGMMIAAADARAERKKKSDEGGGDSGEDEEQEETTTRSTVDTSQGTDTEKLLGNIVASVDDLTKQMKTNNENLLKATLKTSTAVDNAQTEGETPTVKKLQIEGGGGGGGIDYDKLNDVGQNISQITVFNGKAPGRTPLDSFTTKLIASLSDAQKDALFEALKAKTDAAYDAKGAASTALDDAKAYTDSEIGKKHPTT